ncbi:hypothetical protein CDAR_371441 [Caerostris darwini]|uniref:Uncharacterized protein n=1 Tax=Caerostris darwini TaxID=1538125 RepID=A0AAV4XBS9_9ARAC|nr:hypothetical protein CDAR_371441 [Caerostris darwini]
MNADITSSSFRSIHQRRIVYQAFLIVPPGIPKHWECICSNAGPQLIPTTLPSFEKETATHPFPIKHAIISPLPSVSREQREFFLPRKSQGCARCEPQRSAETGDLVWSLRM